MKLENVNNFLIILFQTPRSIQNLNESVRVGNSKILCKGNIIIGKNFYNMYFILILNLIPLFPFNYSKFNVNKELILRFLTEQVQVYF